MGWQQSGCTGTRKEYYLERELNFYNMCKTISFMCDRKILCTKLVLGFECWFVDCHTSPCEDCTLDMHHIKPDPGQKQAMGGCCRMRRLKTENK